MKFELDKEQKDKYKAFKKECLNELLERQKTNYIGTEHEERYKRLTCNWEIAYTGASGGLVSFIFTPTSLGTVIKVSCKTLGKELDLSDYDHW